VSAGVSAGERAHFDALQSLYAAAPINRLFASRLEVAEPGLARIHFDVDERVKVIVLTGAGKTFCAGADLDIGFSSNRERPADHRDG